MFDLEQAITDWKSGFENSDSVSREHLQELELHLRDTVPTLVDNGLADDEAFLVATRRLGHPTALEREFAKVNGSLLWRKRVLWMLCGYVGIGACSTLLGGLSSAGAGVATLAGASGRASGMTSVAMLAVGWVVFLALLYVGATAKNRLRASERVSLKWCFGIVAVMFSGNTIAVLAQLLRSNLWEPSVLGEYYMWASFGGKVVQLIVFVTCVAMTYLLSQPKRQSLELTT